MMVGAPIEHSGGHIGLGNIFEKEAALVAKDSFLYFQLLLKPIHFCIKFSIAYEGAKAIFIMLRSGYY